jgi:hypothetical protein
MTLKETETGLISIVARLMDENAALRESHDRLLAALKLAQQYYEGCFESDGDLEAVGSVEAKTLHKDNIQLITAAEQITGGDDD